MVINDINQYFADRTNIHIAHANFQLFKSIVCADGFHISAQVSGSHYSQPRNCEGPWSSIELCFPLYADPHIQEYAEDQEEPTGTVYGYVPVEVVNAMIVSHGGIDIDKTNERFNQLKEQNND